jgi:hypothetical protein
MLAATAKIPRVASSPVEPARWLDEPPTARYRANVNKSAEQTNPSAHPVAHPHWRVAASTVRKALAERAAAMDRSKRP